MGKQTLKSNTKSVKKGRGSGLTPWKPGQSGNPGGRPPNPESITNLMRQAGDMVGVDGRLRKQALVEMLWRKAEKGDLRAAEYIVDRLEGKPKERQEITGPDSGLLVVIRNASGGNGSGT